MLPIIIFRARVVRFDSNWRACAQFQLLLISAPFERSVGSVWFVRAIDMAYFAMTRTNHTLPTERSNGAEINSMFICAHAYKELNKIMNNNYYNYTMVP